MSRGRSLFYLCLDRHVSDMCKTVGTQAEDDAKARSSVSLVYAIYDAINNLRRDEYTKKE